MTLVLLLGIKLLLLLAFLTGLINPVIIANNNVTKLVLSLYALYNTCYLG